MDKLTIGPKIVFDPAVVGGEVRKAFSMITGKWKLEILWLLNQRVHRFGELKRSIPGITQHMLTAQLRELEADGLVSRQIFAEVPPRWNIRSRRQPTLSSPSWMRCSHGGINTKATWENRRHATVEPDG